MKHEYGSLSMYSTNFRINNRNVSKWTDLPKNNHTFSPFFLLTNSIDSTETIATITQLMSKEGKQFNNVRAAATPKFDSTLFPVLSKLPDDSLDIFTEYYSLRRSSFTKFFNDFEIDTPICFAGSNSIKRRNFEFPMLKFMNFLMQKGKREKVFIAFLKAFRVMFQIAQKDMCLLSSMNY